MQALHSSRSSMLEPEHSKAPADSDAMRKLRLGQFLTPEIIGSFMASLFEVHPAEIRLLDAGAGGGALTAALVKRSCICNPSPTRISVASYKNCVAIVTALDHIFRMYN